MVLTMGDSVHCWRMKAMTCHAMDFMTLQYFMICHGCVMMCARIPDPVEPPVIRRKAWKYLEVAWGALPAAVRLFFNGFPVSSWMGFLSLRRHRKGKKTCCLFQLQMLEILPKVRGSTWSTGAFQGSAINDSGSTLSPLDALHTVFLLRLGSTGTW